jgi:hypothetical protein
VKWCVQAMIQLLSYMHIHVTRPSMGASTGMLLISVKIMSKGLLPLTWKKKSNAGDGSQVNFETKKTNTVLTQLMQIGYLAYCLYVSRVPLETDRSRSMKDHSCYNQTV